MTPWLLGIVGTVTIGVLVELLLTDSALSKFIRGIYAFFILFVIVQPLPGLIKSASENVSGTITYDTQLLATINERSASAAKQALEKTLAAAGYESVLVIIEHDPTAPAFTVARVYLNAIAPVTSPDRAKTKKELTELTAVTLGISETIVEVYI